MALLHILQQKHKELFSASQFTTLQAPAGTAWKWRYSCIVWINSTDKLKEGKRRWHGRMRWECFFRPGSSAAHPLSRSQCPPARTCKEALEREGTWDAYEFCFPYQGDSSLPRACLALTELPGVTFIPVCRKHVFHGWLH